MESVENLWRHNEKEAGVVLYVYKSQSGRAEWNGWGVVYVRGQAVE
jgi:hypothetical protein